MPSVQGLGFPPAGNALAHLPVSPHSHQAHFPCTCDRHGQMLRMQHLQDFRCVLPADSTLLALALYPSAMHVPLGMRLNLRLNETY